MGTSAFGVRSQREYAVYRIFTDQHGRRFEAQSHVINSRPMEDLRCLDAVLPWQPNGRYVDWKGDGLLEFTWNYRKMAHELSIHTNGWYNLATKMALKEKLPVPEVGGEVDPIILEVLGSPGLSPEIPLSAEYGDEWLLWGDQKPRNERLFGLLNQGNRMSNKDSLAIIENRIREARGMGKVEVPADAAVPTKAADAKAAHAFSASHVKYNEFFAAARTRGLTAPEISIAWSDHKKALAEDAR